jgi:PhnB protein
MANEILIEQLDQAVEAILANPDALLPSVTDEIAPLLHIAVALRDLPREDFKLRLKNDLERSTTMATEAKPAKDSKTTTVTPYLVVANVHEEVDFLEKVFAAKGKIYGLGSAGGFHSEYKIGDSALMIGGGGRGSKWKGASTPGSLHVYVEDIDSVYERALQAGATSLMPPTDMEYGERSAAFLDPGGNHWYPATAVGAHYIPEGAPNLMAYLHPRGAQKQIDFLQSAFGAEEVFRHESEGTIYHAKVRIGNSIVEMGEAHDQWQPMPMHFMLYADDVDLSYARAMKAEGAISLGEPANQSYGSRTGSVKDPFDNVWYISGPVTDAKS